MKEVNKSCFEMLDALIGGLKAFPVACKPFMALEKKLLLSVIVRNIYFIV
jgi:hypothetical protein